MGSDEDGSNVIYDLTTKSRSGSALSSANKRPESRNIGVQTTLKFHHKHHKHRKSGAKQCSKIAKAKSQKEPKIPQNGLTIEKIWEHGYLGDYAIPKDAKLPGQFSMKTTLPQKAKLVTLKKKSPKTSTKRHKSKGKLGLWLDRILVNPCVKVSQRKLVKYNLLLSITINVLVLALGGTGFMSILSGDFASDPHFKYGN